MMANITIAKKRSSPIWSKGTMAFMMDLRTTCKPVGSKEIIVVSDWRKRRVFWKVGDFGFLIKCSGLAMSSNASSSRSLIQSSLCSVTIKAPNQIPSKSSN